MSDETASEELAQIQTVKPRRQNRHSRLVCVSLVAGLPVMLLYTQLGAPLATCPNRIILYFNVFALHFVRV